MSISFTNYGNPAYRYKTGLVNLVNISDWAYFNQTVLYYYLKNCNKVFVYMCVKIVFQCLLPEHDDPGIHYLICLW